MYNHTENCSQKRKGNRFETFRARVRVFGVLAGILTGAWLAHATAEPNSPFKPLSVFAQALSELETRYVDSIDSEKLVRGAIQGMLDSLDPHTEYLDKDEYQTLRADTEGAFAGIGVEVAMRDGWLTVLNVFDNGPAAKAGLEPGDRFLKIADEPARDIRMHEAVTKMRGRPGTSVKVLIRRQGVQQNLALNITRATIHVDPVTFRFFSHDIAMVQIRSFQSNTARELQTALDEAVDRSDGKRGLRGLILDLRNNGGGLLRQAVLVSDMFVPSGEIVSTRGRGDVLLESFRAHGLGTRPSWPMVVLVNAQTASAAEIVAGALSDSGRAFVIGERTFGKGTVQEVIELLDGSAMKVTIAKYFTPAGRSIQAQGIEPDLVIAEASDNPDELIREEDLEGHLRAAKKSSSTERKLTRSVAIDANLAVPTAIADDAQAAAAYRWLRQRSAN
ncbi:MAG: S41 family peptidase [Polyangiales bacterium]